MEFKGMLIQLLLLFTASNLMSLLKAATPPPSAPPFSYPFMTTDAEKASAGKYDYIIVGGGTAGCPLAATLSQNYSVLVLERGGSPYGNSEIEDSRVFGKPLGETDKYTSIAQGFVSEDGVHLARARVLGGGTALNAGYYSRASSEYIRKMRWDEKMVNQSYEWVEKMNAFMPKNLSTWSAAFKNALLEVGVLPDNGYTVDHVKGTKISASTFDNNGKRHTAADLLNYANPRNIVVLLNATASRILFNSTSGTMKARGVEFINSINVGRPHQVMVDELSPSSEVILAAGSIGSPHLLLLSGIGPSQSLKQLNIPVLVNLPGVGKGVQDSPRATLSVKSPTPLGVSSIQVVGILNNSQLYIFSSSFEQHDPSNKTFYTGSLFEKLASPLSRGELQLVTTDPRDNPSVRYNYYSHPADLQKCVQGLKVLGSLCETASMQKFAYNGESNGTGGLQFMGTAMPANKSDYAEMGKFCRETLNTMWHFHGGCHVGSVVDKSYKLKRVQGVRVVDGSTFKDGPGTNPQATTMMLGRYVGMKILQERASSSTEA